MQEKSICLKNCGYTKECMGRIRINLKDSNPWINSLPVKKKEIIDITGASLSTVFDHVLRILSKCCYGNIVFPYHTGYAFFYKNSYGHLDFTPLNSDLLATMMSSAAAWIDLNSSENTKFNKEHANLFLESVRTRTAILNAAIQKFPAFKPARRTEYNNISIARSLLLSYLDLVDLSTTASGNHLLLAILNARQSYDWANMPMFFIGHYNDPDRAIQLVEDIAHLSDNMLYRCNHSTTPSDISSELPQIPDSSILLFENINSKLYNNISDAHDVDIEDGSSTCCKLIGTFDYAKTNPNIFNNSCLKIMLRRKLSVTSGMPSTIKLRQEILPFIAWAISEFENEHDRSVERLDYAYSGPVLYGCGTWDEEVCGVLECNGINLE